MKMEGWTSTKGLVTPLRTAASLSNKFRVAYSYGENIEKVVEMNPTKMKDQEGNADRGVPHAFN